jgi:hypothetical protein
MTDFVKVALCAALAATLPLAVASTTVAAKSHNSNNLTMKRGSFGLTAGAQGQSAGQNNTFCGKGDVIVIYDEDANGKPIPGTERYGCTD